MRLPLVFEGENFMTHRILLIATGGTISGNIATNKQVPEHRLITGGGLADISRDNIEYLRLSEGMNVEIEVCEFCEEDSSNIKPEHWVGLSKIIIENYDKFESFVISHGTNTLGYTCAALSFIFANIGKPIVLTGSQVPVRYPASDAKMNLDNAIRIATWSKNLVRGVLCVFGTQVMTGTRVKKDTEFDYDAFKTFQSGSVARIGRVIDFNVSNLNKHISYHETPHYRVARNSRELVFENNFDSRIASLTEIPGMDPGILRSLMKEHKIQGFILRAFGAGDLASSFVETLEYLKDNQVPVVATTQAPNGNATLQVNEPGQFLAERDLVIPAYNMSHESQVTKLAWLLAQRAKGQLRYEDLAWKFLSDLRGEIDVIWEDDLV